MPMLHGSSSPRYFSADLAPTPPLKLLGYIAKEGVRTEYKQRSPIYVQGDVADSVFYILEGRVKITVVSEQGKEAIVAMLEKESFFGEGCLAGQSHRRFSASAASDCLLLKIAKKVITRMIQQQPGFSELFVSFLLTRTMRYEDDLVDHLFNSSEKRLARVLLLLSDYNKEGKPGKAMPKISQEDLAQMVGTTRARISHFMNKFRDQGFIDYKKSMQVRSSLMNVIHQD